jgi:hypothetical protein
MSHRVGLVLLAVLTATGCKQGSSPASAGGGVGSPNFELDCRSSNTATAAELFCVRTDTRSGDVVRVMHMSLPTSNGPTALEKPEAAGRFTTVCDATSTDIRSDLYCVRLNTETGEMLLVNLQKVPSIPATK